MNTDEHGYLNSLTEKVLGAVFEVSNTLGAGFLEKVYERAQLLELRGRGIRATGQTSLAVSYKGQTVRASGLPICLLINFQKPKVKWKRVISDLCSSVFICG
jgi:hypothetical protein